MEPDRSIFAASFADGLRLHRALARSRRWQTADRLFHVREAMRYRALARRLKGG